MRAAMLASIVGSKPEYRNLLEKDKEWLKDAMFADLRTYGYFAPADNKFRITPESAYRDLSNTRYQATWACGCSATPAWKCRKSPWKLVESCWVSQQNKDGSWPYYVAGRGGANAVGQTMTLAGVASLFVDLGQDLLDLQRATGQGPGRFDR